jgi:hypothetical protein
LIGSVALLPDMLTFNGSKTLAQFDIMGTTFIPNFDGSRLHADIKIKVKFDVCIHHPFF